MAGIVDYGKGVGEEGDEIGLMHPTLSEVFNHEGTLYRCGLKGTVPERDCIVNIIAEDYIFQASIGDAWIKSRPDRVSTTAQSRMGACKVARWGIGTGQTR
jgi:hypothetical protein